MEPTADQTTIPGTPAAAPAKEPGDSLSERAQARRSAGKGKPKAADVKPKRKPGRPAGATAKVKIEKQVRELLATAGGTVAMIDPFSGAVILERHEGFAHALAAVADENPRVRQMIEGMALGGVYGALAFHAALIGLPIAARFGLLPEPYRSLAISALGPEGVSEAAEPAPGSATRPAPSPVRPHPAAAPGERPATAL